jgi:uncharacterized protein
MKSLTEKLAALDWNALSDSLDTMGYALTPQLLDADTCAAIAMNYDDDTLFRSTINMARHGFGKGQYRYFSYPLPALVEMLRTELYPPSGTHRQSVGRPAWSARHLAIVARRADRALPRLWPIAANTADAALPRR